MSDVTAAAQPTAGLRRVLTVLCITEITSWGVLYYAFPVLAPTISVHTGWSQSVLMAAFSLSLVVAAVVGVPVGRLLDRYGPMAVMTTGSVIAVPALIGVVTAQSVAVFFASWFLAGVAMAGVLYQPAFAAVTRWYGPRRVAALTTVTLIAGLASTAFAPLTAALASHVDWRSVYLILAVVLAVVTIPLHFWGLRLPWPEAEREAVRHEPDEVARSRSFIALVISMSLAAFAVYAVVVNMVPLLTGRGLSTATAAWALGLSGAGQVLGRLGYRRLVAATTVRSRTLIILLAAAATTALLAAVPALIILVGALVGVTRGIFTLLQATAVPDRWGSAHYGRLSGLLAAPLTVTSAVAPWVGAALAGWFGGYPEVFGVLAATGVLAAVVAMASAPRREE
ncbi:MFS transporter [Kibdelosporangium aridum]|uniref:MFS transporter n=1 Tax=Kibdelosporangium aridum TaxID=2030 RepID=UPI000527AED9